MVCLSGMNNASCWAQSIVGKWKLASMSGFMVYKSSGKKVDVSKFKTDLVFEFKSDNTYIQSNSSGKYQNKGTYTVSGDQLKMIIDTRGFTEEQRKAVEKRAQIAKVKFKRSATMIWHSILNDEDYNSDIESTLNKL